MLFPKSDKLFINYSLIINFKDEKIKISQSFLCRLNDSMCYVFLLIVQ